MFGLHYRLERKAIGLVLAIIGVASIGGIVEIAPLFTIPQTVEDAPDMVLIHRSSWRDATSTSARAVTPVTLR